MYKKWTMKENADSNCKTVSGAHAVMICHFEAYTKANYPCRHIVLSFLQMKNVVDHCERSLVITQSWIVVINQTIFLMRTVFFRYIVNEVEDS